jgi:hypothetical protein
MTFTPSAGPLVRLNVSVGFVGITPMINVYDRDHPRFVVDPVDDPVAAPASGVPVIQWWQKAPTKTVRIVQQWSVDELERGERDRPGKPLRERLPNGRSDTQREMLRRSVTHAE